MTTMCQQNDNIKVINSNIAKIEQKENKKRTKRSSYLTLCEV